MNWAGCSGTPNSFTPSDAGPSAGLAADKGLLEGLLGVGIAEDVAG